MLNYKGQLKQIVNEYRKESQPWPASTTDIANWAIKTGRFDLPHQAIIKICARDLAQAMREEYITDSKGRRIRAKHPARINRDGEQKVLWDDIRTATHTFMRMAFMNRRNRIVGECRQAKVDVDSYNDSHPNEEPIQLILDFTQDVEELEQLENLNKVEMIEELV